MLIAATTDVIIAEWIFLNMREPNKKGCIPILYPSHSCADNEAAFAAGRLASLTELVAKMPEEMTDKKWMKLEHTGCCGEEAIGFNACRSAVLSLIEELKGV